MARSPRRQIVVWVTREEWRQLAAQAVEAERDPFQQARWLLVKALRENEAPPSDIEPEPALIEAAS